MTNKQKHILKVLAFLSPWIIGFIVFQLYPIASSVYYSFCYYDILRPPGFIGLDNYRSLLTDEVFLHSLIVTGIYAALAIPLSLIVSLFFAILLNQKIFGRGMFRVIYFLPSLIPMAALGVLWKWVLHGEHGILNHILKLLHIPAPNWLGSTAWATPAMVLTGIWAVGGSIVIYLAALQDVPKSLYESAEIDGAGFFGKVRHVTLPMISPVIYFNLVMTIIASLQFFVIPYIITEGGPARSTYYYTLYLFDNAFRFLRMGYASAMAIILFIIIFALTMVTSKIASKKVYYAGK